MAVEISHLLITMNIICKAISHYLRTSILHVICHFCSVVLLHPFEIGILTLMDLIQPKIQVNLKAALRRSVLFVNFYAQVTGHCDCQSLPELNQMLSWFELDSFVCSTLLSKSEIVFHLETITRGLYRVGVL